MRISVDASVAYPSFGGFISYIQRLSVALESLTDVELTLFAPSDAIFALPGLPASMATEVIELELSACETRRSGEVWVEDVLPRALERSRPDAHLGPAFMLPPWEGPQAVTVHDTMFETLPQHYSPATREFLSGSTRRALARADVILAVSEATAADTRTTWRPAAPVVVTPLAPNLPEPLDVGNRPHAAPYLLNVGVPTVVSASTSSSRRSASW